jgi:hypothetical protein
MTSRSRAALKAWKTRRAKKAFAKARASESASKAALKAYCAENGWRVAFFEGTAGGPRTGIIDAAAFRLGRRDADVIEIRLIQLKGGSAGINAREISRLKAAVATARVGWMIAAFDGRLLHVIPEPML